MASPRADAFDFSLLLDLDARALLYELADSHTNLANLHVQCAFLRAEKIRDPKGYAPAKLAEMEGELHAYEEKKWLLVALLKHRDLGWD